MAVRYLFLLLLVLFCSWFTVFVLFAANRIQQKTAIAIIRYSLFAVMIVTLLTMFGANYFR